VPLSDGTGVEGTVASLMEVVRTTVACECVYVRGMVIKALIWMQNPHESFDELRAIIASELSDPAWPSALLDDILLTLHARFKVFLGESSVSYRAACLVLTCIKHVMLCYFKLVMFFFSFSFSSYCSTN